VQAYLINLVSSSGPNLSLTAKPLGNVVAYRVGPLEEEGNERGKHRQPS